MTNEKSEKNYSRNCVLRTETVMVKEAYWKGSLQRFEFYFYEPNKPVPKKQVFVQLDGKVIVE